MRQDLGQDSYLEYHETFFPPEEADRYLERLLSEDTPWERQTIMGVLTRRANAWFADDPAFVYRYSGQTWHPHPFTPELTEIRQRLEELSEPSLNSVLGAYYPDGQAGVNWHDDNDFPSLPDLPIVTVTFGSVRKFKVRRKQDKEVVAEYDLAHGSVVIMGGAMQRHFDHALPKTSKKVGPRVNLSYRTFHPPE